MMNLYVGYLVTLSAVPSSEMRSLFVAIRAVETSGLRAPGQAVGDNGRSLGPYQISRAYWADSGMAGKWEWCRDRAYSEAVMSAYWKRHCPDALRRRDAEVLARIHNGGPRGPAKRATWKYWQKVNRQLVKPARR